jgi:outer membrane protein TolC
MRKFVVIFLLISQFALGQSSDSLDIFQCFDAIEKFYPKSEEKQLIEEQTQLELENIQAQWYPQLNLNAQASYQSDVVEVDIGDDLPFPVDFPTASKDQYKATIDVNQRIYDGGASKSSKKLERIEGEANRQSVDVTIHQVKKQVANAFFGVLLLQKQQAIIENTFEELKKKKKTVQAGVESGVLLSSDLKSIQAELLKLNQNRDELKTKLKANIKVLEELTGLKMQSAEHFLLPEIQLSDSLNYNRPEHELFSLQREQLEQNKSLVKSQQLPKVFAFGQVGYGKPGLNMLKDEFDSFYLLGLKLKWNIWDWNQNKRKRQIIEVQREKVNVQKNTFNKTLNVNMEAILADIDNYRKALERDKRIISLRREVAESARSKLENGTITSSQYITELNQLKNAKIKYEEHRVKLQKAKMSYLLTKGISNVENQNIEK